METPDRAISTSIWPENSLKVSSDLEDKNAKTCATCLAGSILPCTCACSNDDMGFVVEELTLKNYEQSKLSIIGNFDRMEGMESRKGHRKNLYNLASGSGNGNMHGDALSKQPFTTDGGDDAGTTKRPEFQVQKRPVSRKLNKTCLSENLNNADRGAASDYVMHRREKSAKSSTISGFTQFFVKNALMEKRIACRNSEACDGFGATASGQNEGKENCANVISVKCIPETDYLPSHNVHEQYPITQIMFQDGINLREWLRPGFRKVNKAESLHIFMQIVKLVDMAHSQQIALQDITPSCFELLPSNQVKYVGSLTSRESANSSTGAGLPYLEHHLSRKRSMEQGADAYNGVYSKHQKLDGNLKFALEHTQSVAAPDLKWKRAGTVGIETQDSGNPLRHEYNSNSELHVQNRSWSSCAPYTSQQKLPWSDIQLENKWYTSPEELHGSGLTISSNIYGLGVLLFELLCCFESLEGHAAAMSDLRHRILPPNFLSENPKETGFCLWILHPEPSSRPTTREILQSEIIRGSRELPVSNQLAAPADEDDTESELLLHFLTIVKDEKQKKATRLIEDINYLEADLEEVSKRHISKTGGIFGRSHKAFFEAREPGFADKEYVDLGLMSDYLSNKNESRLTRNRSQLESAYFSVRSQMQLQDTNSTARVDKDLIRNRDGWNSVQIENEDDPNQIPNDRMGVFFDGLCKYARYSKFEQRAVLRNGDLLNSANVIRSLNFDRDEDYFAAAGVSKKIKIFDFHALLNESVDIHYPVIEMTNKSKLSCVCWNNYIKNYLASTDYDGDVQLWDVSTGQVFSQYMEHEKRAWSADFSQVDPKKLASGSDDGSVKLWSINEQKSISTIRSIANICCVQFSSHSTNLLAFGSADYKTYCYDLRNTRIPWCTLAGHGKAVSYVKFLDAGTLISASTDNTLKLWDLNKTSSSGLSTSACSLTFTGHTNEKNFVGLSVSDGYIACGSETNEVYAYQRSLPVPITSYKFGSVDPISGQETGDDNGQFVSSVCWRGKSNMVVTANSTGSIKLLELV